MPRAGVLTTAIAAAAMMAGTALASDWRGESVDWTDVDGVDRTALYPAVGGDPMANLRLDALGGKLIGANGDFIQSPSTPPSQSWAPQVMSRLRSAGLGAVRTTVSWTTHERDRDVWTQGEWDRTTRFYESALANSMTPILVLTFSPHWASSAADCRPPGLLNPDPQCNRPPDNTKAMNDEWQEFVEHAATLYPKAVFEIWNEPNVSEFWGSIAPQRWAELAGIAARKINLVTEPDAPVLGCACAGIITSLDATAMSVGTFLQQAYSYTGPDSIRGGWLDGVSFHFRPQDYNPFAPLDFSAGSHFAALVNQVRQATAAAGEAGKPIWIDEMGYWTADAGNQWHVMTEAETAAGDAELTRIALTTPDIKAVLIHRDVDEPAGGNSNGGAIRQSTMGLLRGDLSAKPSFCQFAAMFGHYATPEGIYKHPLCPQVVAPNTVISPSPPVFFAAGDDVEFSFSGTGSGPNLFECRLDSGPVRRCASPISYDGLSLGAHTFQVRAYRLDGAQDETPAQWTFLVSEPSGTTTTTTPATTTSTRPTTTTVTTTSTTGGGGTKTTTTGKTTTTSTGRTSTTTTGPGGDLPPGCDIAGTRGNDVLYGTGDNDRICGLGGDDKIYALRGRDAIVGGGGRDRIMGGSGADAILGDNSGDRLMGGAGNDWISGGRGNDRLNGGPGRDVLKGGPGRNRKRK